MHECLLFTIAALLLVPYEPVSASLTDIHDAVDAKGDFLGCFAKPSMEFLSFDVLNKGWRKLIAAEQAVKGDRDLRFRVRVAQLPVIYTFMMKWAEFRDRAKAAKADWPMPRSIKATFEKFIKIAEKKDITRLDEWHKGFEALEKEVAKAQE